MKYLFWALGPLILTLLNNLIFRRNLETFAKDPFKDYAVITIPKSYSVITSICGGFFTFIFFYDFTPNKIGIVQFIWLSFMFLCLIFLWYCNVMKIELYIREGYLVYRNIILKKRTIHSGEIKSYEYGRNCLVLNLEKGKLKIDFFWMNFDYILSFIGKHKITEQKKKK